MTDTTYNGWTNYETWLVNIHFECFEFTDEIDEGMFDDLSRDEVKDWIANYIQECVEEVTYSKFEVGESDNLFLMDCVQSTLGEVDWDDIADHYLDDVMKAQQERLENA